MTDSSRQSLAYPLRISPSGGLELARGDSVIQDRIRSVLETRPYEMPMRANYGISDQAFTVIIAPDAIAERIRQAIELQVPDITPFVSAISEETNIQRGKLALRITWQDASQPLGTVAGLLPNTSRNVLNYTIQL